MLTEQLPRIRVLIVDDHELTRLGLELLLSRQETIEVVGLASNGKEGIEQVQLYSPDVVILDLQMPILNGLSAAAGIKQVSPHTQIIAYTSVEDPQLETMIQTVPIDRLCPKDISTEVLVKIIKQLGQRSYLKRDDG